jgi:hypothetical protein
MIAMRNQVKADIVWAIMLAQMMIITVAPVRLCLQDYFRVAEERRVQRDPMEEETTIELADCNAPQPPSNESFHSILRSSKKMVSCLNLEQ